METRAEPVALDGEAIMEMRACALNFADTLMLKGKYQEKPPYPLTPGMEVAGLVEGRRMAGFIGYGGLAERVAVRPDTLTEIPEALDFAEAASLPIAYGTAHLALDHRAALKPGERLVVTGAGGGVGLTGVMMGKLLGAEVIAVARGADKLEAARQAGADHLIESDTDLRQAVKDLGGADVVYDAVGGEIFTQLLRATNPEGRIIPIGFASGDVAPIPANHLLVKNITVIGLYWGGYLKFAPDVLRDSLAKIYAWAAEGKITPQIGHRLPLDDAAEGLAMLTERRALGKVVITNEA
ncbi:NADPH:quinone oxidoreductase family protein [Paracoccaceae bacterium GXU_MW_L88]